VYEVCEAKPNNKLKMVKRQTAKHSIETADTAFYAALFSFEEKSIDIFAVLILN